MFLRRKHARDGHENHHSETQQGPHGEDDSAGALIRSCFEELEANWYTASSAIEIAFGARARDIPCPWECRGWPGNGRQWSSSCQACIDQAVSRNTGLGRTACGLASPRTHLPQPEDPRICPNEPHRLRPSAYPSWRAAQNAPWKSRCPQDFRFSELSLELHCRFPISKIATCAASAFGPGRAGRQNNIPFFEALPRSTAPEI